MFIPLSRALLERRAEGPALAAETARGAGYWLKCQDSAQMQRYHCSVYAPIELQTWSAYDLPKLETEI